MIEIVDAYRRDLEFSYYLKSKGLKLLQEDSVVAGPDDLVISRAELGQLKQDMKTIGKELKNKLKENAELEQRVEELEERERIAQGVKEEKRQEIKDLSDRLIERIRKL